MANQDCNEGKGVMIEIKVQYNLRDDESDENGRSECLPLSHAGGSVEKSKRVTAPVLTEYERINILSK